MTRRFLVTLLLAAGALAQAQPRRIVTTSPSITETVFALGLGSRVVGVSEYCRFPQEVMRLPKVGSFLKPNAEQIARLEPDLAIIHQLPGDLTARLQALGIRYLEVERGGLPSLYRMMEQIGVAAGVAPRARELATTIQAKLAAVRERSSGLAKPKVIFIVGRRLGTLSDIVAVGSDSYLNELIRTAGAENALTGGSLPGYPSISVETVIRLDPDFLIDVADPMVDAKQSDKRQRAVTALWSQQSGLKAVRAKRVFAMDSEAFVVPGPRVVDVAEALFDLFHGRGPR